MDVNDILGGKKIPSQVKFETKGTKHIIAIDEVKSVAVREFVKGKPGEQLYFQSKKKVRESELNLALPYEPIPCILVIGKVKDGTEVSLRLEGERLKAARQAVRDGGVLAVGGKIAIEFYDEDDSGNAPFPKKLYKVQLQAPKG